MGGNSYSINWIWPPGSLTMPEKTEEWEGKGIFLTFNSEKVFYPAISREHWAALKRFAEDSARKTPKGKKNVSN